MLHMGAKEVKTTCPPHMISYLLMWSVDVVALIMLIGFAGWGNWVGWGGLTWFAELCNVDDCELLVITSLWWARLCFDRPEGAPQV